MSKFDTKYPAGTITVKGMVIPVNVSDAGAWEAEFSGFPYYAMTKADLRAQVLRAATKARVVVTVPFTQLVQAGTARRPQWEARRGLGIGIHSNSGNVLVHWEDGSGGQLTGTRSEVLKKLDDQQIAEWIRLTVDMVAARTALDEFESTHSARLHATVREHIEAATSAALAQEDPDE